MNFDQFFTTTENLAPAESVAKIQSHETKNNSNNRQRINHLSSRIRTLFPKSNIRQNTSNNCQKESNLGLSYLTCQINHFSSDNSSVFTAKDNDSIAATMFSVNVNTSFVTSIENNQAATKLEKTDEKTLSWELENFINFNHSTSTIYL